MRRHPIGPYIFLGFALAFLAAALLVPEGWLRGAIAGSYTPQGEAPGSYTPK